MAARDMIADYGLSPEPRGYNFANHIFGTGYTAGYLDHTAQEGIMLNRSQPQWDGQLELGFGLVDDISSPTRPDGSVSYDEMHAEVTHFMLDFTSRLGFLASPDAPFTALLWGGSIKESMPPYQIDIAHNSVDTAGRDSLFLVDRYVLGKS